MLTINRVILKSWFGYNHTFINVYQSFLVICQFFFVLAWVAKQSMKSSSRVLNLVISCIQPK